VLERLALDRPLEGFLLLLAVVPQVHREVRGLHEQRGMLGRQRADVAERLPQIADVAGIAGLDRVRDRGEPLRGRGGRDVDLRCVGASAAGGRARRRTACAVGVAGQHGARDSLVAGRPRERLEHARPLRHGAAREPCELRRDRLRGRGRDRALGVLGALVSVEAAFHRLVKTPAGSPRFPVRQDERP
jgi:hypothetical protein